MITIEVSKEDRFLLSSTSKGNQPKWFINNMYVKADDHGYEGLAEAFVSELESHIVNAGFRYVDYELCIIEESIRDFGTLPYKGCFFQ